MALDASTAPDILMQPLDFFPISSCNSWALPGLPTLPSLQRMSIGPAGACISQACIAGSQWQGQPLLVRALATIPDFHECLSCAHL